ncbi:FRG domain-containing protein [Burkholderia cepacia]
MTEQENYEELDIENCIMNVRLSSWKHFHEYVVTEMLDFSHYVWRGQRDADWGLETSLDRIIKPKNTSSATRTLNKHLEKFKQSSLGRRGQNPKTDLTENDWWALGQHNGLATPLLDWTKSPFVALYFAFSKEEQPKSGNRAVWALGTAHTIINAIKKQDPNATVLEYIRPRQDENTRLVSQGGLFTRVPLGFTVKTWIEAHSEKETDKDAATLLRILIPDTGREECLRTLNMMNINHVTLFPDLYGAGKHCNNSLLINKYV